MVIGQLCPNIAATLIVCYDPAMVRMRKFDSDNPNNPDTLKRTLDGPAVADGRLVCPACSYGWDPESTEEIEAAVLTPTHRRRGRPSKEIDLDYAAHMASLGATHTEIAAGLGISRSTLQAKLVDDAALREAIEDGKERGKLSLRAAQHKAARRGNTAMQQWLGMDRLGQRTRRDVQIEEVKPAPKTVFEWLGIDVSALPDWKLDAVAEHMEAIESIVGREEDNGAE